MKPEVECKPCRDEARRREAEAGRPCRTGDARECTTCHTDKGYLCACETDDVRARLEQIRKRADAAEPGPWMVGDESPTHEGMFVVSCEGGEGDVTDYIDRPEAEFIAHAREDVPWLLDRIQALEQRAEVRRLDLAGALLLEAETAHEAIVAKAERLASNAMSEMPTGARLLTEACELREVAAIIDGLNPDTYGNGMIAELIRVRADRKEAEAKGGV